MRNVRAYTLNNSQDSVIISIERENGLFSFFEASMSNKDSNGQITLSPVDNIFDYAPIGMQYNEELTGYFKQNEGIGRSNGRKK